MASSQYIRDIDSKIVPKYRNYYVSYKQLSDAIDLLREREAGVDSSSSSLLKGLLLPKDFTFGDTSAIYGLVEQRPEVRFVSLLEHELSKINHFTALEIKTMLALLRQMDRKLNRILLGEDMDAATSRKFFPSAVDDSELALSREDRLASVYDRLVGLSDEMLILEHYVKLNIVIFREIVQEFDDAFSDRPSVGNWFISKLYSEPFAGVPLNALFTIVAKLFVKCERPLPQESGPELAYTVSPENSLRVRLLLSSLTPLDRPDSVPELVWNLASTNRAIPVRAEDIQHEAMRSSTEWIRVVVEDEKSSIKSMSYTADGEDAPLHVENTDGTHQTIKRDDFLSQMTGDCTWPVTLVNYDETRFGSTRFVDNVRVIRCPLFNLEAFLQDFPNLESGLAGPSGSIGRRPSVGSSGSGSISGWTSVSTCVLFTPSSVIRERLSDLLTPMPPTFTLNAITSMPPSSPEIIVPEVRLKPYSPIASPLDFHHPHPTLPMSPKTPIQQAPPRLPIYPKNFMANERSFLAWISAVSVQSGIGLALLGKSGVSFIGAVISIIALIFLWWAVYVFVRRHRHLKSHSDTGGEVFYSMELPTVFGCTQIVILAIQSLVMLWW